jgi:hypothetical protein
MAQQHKKKDLGADPTFLKVRDWVVVWGVCPGTKWYWPSAAFFAGMWVAMAIVLMSVGLPEQNFGTMMFAYGCLLGGAANFGVFWYYDRRFKTDRQRVKMIKASWGSEDLSVKYSDWKPI